MMECYKLSYMGFGCCCATAQALCDMKTEGVLKFMKCSFELIVLIEQTTVGFSSELTIADLRVEYKLMGTKITTDNTPWQNRQLYDNTA